MEYKKQLVKFNINKISVLSVILFIVPFVIAAAINLFAFKRELLLTDKVYWDIILTVALFIVGLVAHEGLHALGGIAFGKAKPKDIKFGIIPKQFMLYCHIKTPMKAWAYEALLLLPVIVTGVIPLILSAFLGNIFLVLTFSALLSGGAGDIIMFKSLIKYDKNQLIIDHAEAPAYYLVYPENKLPDNFIEATEEQEEELRRETSGAPRGTTTGRSNLIKILAILIFLALTVLIVFLLALFMKLF